MVEPIFSDIKVQITENTTMLVIESSNLGLRVTYGVPVNCTSAFEEMIAENFIVLPFVNEYANFVIFCHYSI